MRRNAVFFIRAAKKNSIVLDGLIKKKSLKRIAKILSKLSQKYDDYGIIRWTMEEKIKEYERVKIRNFHKKGTSSIYINNIQEKESIKIKNKNSFKKEFVIINNDIMNDLGECNAKQTKDIIIIMDFNIYNPDGKNELFIDKIDAFIDQIISILENYLSSNDRLGTFIYKIQYQIICPLITKDKIDIGSFSKDLIYYKKTILNKTEEESSLDELNESDLGKEKLQIQNENKYLSESGSQASLDSLRKEVKIDNIIKGLIDSVNYSINYLKLKEDVENEKYIILFTDIFNTYKMTDEIIKKSFNNLNIEKEITFLLVGKNQKIDITNNKKKLLDLEEEIRMNKLLKEKFGEKSEAINFENMKKIIAILSSNNVIKDEIIYPNEIYK